MSEQEPEPSLDSPALKRLQLFDRQALQRLPLTGLPDKVHSTIETHCVLAGVDRLLPFSAKRIKEAVAPQLQLHGALPGVPLLLNRVMLTNTRASPTPQGA